MTLTERKVIGERTEGMGWLHDEFERSNVRRFQRAIESAKAEFARLPKHRQETLAREFQEAADAALRHAQYNRPGWHR